MEPLPSGAHPPTLTLQVDNGAPIDILNYGGAGDTPDNIFAFPLCTAAESALGYNFCYNVNIGGTYTGTPPAGVSQRNFTIQNYDGSTFARLLIADRVAGDLITLSGVNFVPLTDGSDWPSTERHVLSVTMGNTFNLVSGCRTVVNTACGNYVFYLRTAGVFAPLNDVDAVGDQIYYSGSGLFDPITIPPAAPAANTTRRIANASNLEETTPSDSCSGANAARLKFCVGGVGAPLDYNKVQVATLPNFPCDNRQPAGVTTTFTFTSGVPVTTPVTPSAYSYTGRRCTEQVSTTMRFTFFGPDGVNLSTSNNEGAKCQNNAPDGESEDGEGPGSACVPNAQGDLVGLAVTQEAAEDPQNLIAAATPCDESICNGTLKIRIRATPAKDAKTLFFPFTGSGPFGVAGDFAIQATSNGTGGPKTFEDLFTRDPVTGANGPGYVIDAAFVTIIGSRNWQVDQISCTSTLGTTIRGVDFETGSGSIKGPLVVHALGNGDTLDCLFHVHNK